MSLFGLSPKALPSRARGYLSELRRATSPKESHFSFCSHFYPAEFFANATNLSSSTATGPDKVAYPCQSTFLALAWIFSFKFLIIPGLCIPFLLSGRHLILFPSIKWEILSTLRLSSGLYLSAPASQSFLNALFYRDYSSFYSLTLFSLPARPVSSRLNSVSFSAHIGWVKRIQVGLSDDSCY